MVDFSFVLGLQLGDTAVQSPVRLADAKLPNAAQPRAVVRKVRVYLSRARCGPFDLRNRPRQKLNSEIAGLGVQSPDENCASNKAINGYGFCFGDVLGRRCFHLHETESHDLPQVDINPVS